MYKKYSSRLMELRYINGASKKKSPCLHIIYVVNEGYLTMISYWKYFRRK